MNSEHKTLLERVEMFFDCRLTDDEERKLRQELSACRLQHPVIDEARAVMGLRRPGRKGAAFRPWFMAAASVALVAIIAARVLIPSSSASECVAYCNGKVVTDEEQVMALFASDVAAVAPVIDKCENEI